MKAEEDTVTCPEVVLSPGWLKIDMDRAAARVAQWRSDDDAWEPPEGDAQAVGACYQLTEHPYRKVPKKAPIGYRVTARKIVENTMKTLLVMGALLSLAACNDAPNTAEANINNRRTAGEVVKVAEAPDGTVLWSVYVDGRAVYFSASGASWRRSCGKKCMRTETTPNDT